MWCYSVYGTARAHDVIALDFLCLPALGPGESCEFDADCDLGQSVPVDLASFPTMPGLASMTLEGPSLISFPPGIAAPRPDGEPSTGFLPPTNPIGYAQCATDRDCPDGYTCTRRSSNESWYCRKR